MILEVAKLALHMRRMALIIGAIFGLMWCGYAYLNSDIGLLSDETLIGIISDDILGNSEYGTSCSRTSYEPKVASESGDGAGSAYLTFIPIKGEEDRCPLFPLLRVDELVKHGLQVVLKENRTFRLCGHLTSTLCTPLYP